MFLKILQLLVLLITEENYPPPWLLKKPLCLRKPIDKSVCPGRGKMGFTFYTWAKELVEGANKLYFYKAVYSSYIIHLYQQDIGKGFILSNTKGLKIKRFLITNLKRRLTLNIRVHYYIFKYYN